MDIEIKPIKPSQAKALCALAKTTFFEAFAADNTEDDMNIYADTAFTVARTRSELEAENSYFYFIKVDGETVGYLKLNTKDAQSETLLDHAVEVERIYISAAFQGKGLGHALFDFSEKFARDRQAKWLWLGVWEHNQGAIAFYKKRGLEPFATHPFMLGHSKQTDLLMQLSLLPA